MTAEDLKFREFGLAESGRPRDSTWMTAAASGRSF